MELEISKQALSLLAALLTGFVLGLFYDALIPLRKRSLIFSDALFALILFALSFMLGMEFCSGKLGVFEFSALWTGFFLYRRSLRKYFLALAKKVQDYLKFFFPNEQ